MGDTKTQTILHIRKQTAWNRSTNMKQINHKVKLIFACLFQQDKLGITCPLTPYFKLSLKVFGAKWDFQNNANYAWKCRWGGPAEFYGHFDHFLFSDRIFPKIGIFHVFVHFSEEFLKPVNLQFSLHFIITFENGEIGKPWKLIWRACLLF